MAIRKPLVINAGQIQQLQSGDSLDIQAEALNLTNGEAGSVVIGAPVYMFGNDSFKKAQANGSTTKDVVGLVAATSIANGASGAVTIDGVMTATTAQWDAVTGQTGGLTFGTRYYLDPSTSGKMTTTAPTTVGQYVVEIGVALSTTEMKVDVKSPILL